MQITFIEEPPLTDRFMRRCRELSAQLAKTTNLEKKRPLIQEIMAINSYRHRLPSQPNRARR